MSVYVCHECGQGYGGPGVCSCGGALTEFIPQAQAAADRVAKGAGLVMMMAYNVGPDGKSTLGFDGQSSAMYQFFAPSRAPKCLLTVVVMRSGVTVTEMADPLGTCKKRVIAPRCTAASVWARVKAKKPSMTANKAMLMFQDVQGYDQWFWMGPGNEYYYFDDKCGT